MAAIDCEDCKRWIVNVKEGKFAERGGRRQPRAPGQPTPCKQCPKESSERAAKLRLTRAHWATLMLYVRSRATFGRSLTPAEAADPIVQRNFAAIDVVFRSFDRNETAKTIAHNLPLSRPNVR